MLSSVNIVANKAEIKRNSLDGTDSEPTKRHFLLQLRVFQYRGQKTKTRTTNVPDNQML
jgi:hypothetical protein